VRARGFHNRQFSVSSNGSFICAVADDFTVPVIQLSFNSLISGGDIFGEN